MTEVEFYLVDAFTDRPLSGNACAVFWAADALSQESMQAVAREMNQAESAFALEPSATEMRARYFTPAEEIPFAGHPTVALAAVMAARGKLGPGDETTFGLELPAGIFPVKARRTASGAFVTMEQQRPKWDPPLDRGIVAAAFGLSAADLRDDAPPMVVSTGTRQLMVPVRDHQALRRAAVDETRYRELAARERFFGPHLFCLGGATPEGNTFARHFGVPPDLPEDPFTGSATGGMACYLWRHGLIAHPRFVAEQGHWLGRPGRATVELAGPPSNIETVKVSGGAVIVGYGIISIA